MKVFVDHSLCEGHAKCMEAAPEVFDVRDDDRSWTLIEIVPADLEEAVMRAVRTCPRAAISIEE